jgi:medium-chain acyl-[acyl-carrier-protein] hydrolase
LITKDLVLSKTYDIKYYDQNMKIELKESSLLNFMQDIATISAQTHGFGPAFVFSNNYAWFVLKYHIELNPSMELTRNIDSVTLTTEPRGTNRLFAYRNFEILNPDGRKIGAASSQWALIDMTEKKMLNVEKLLPLKVKHVKREDDLDFEKIPDLEKAEYTKEFEIRFEDIDVNRHANNSNYIVWALETLPCDFRMKKNIRSFDINYKKESSLGMKINSQSEFVDENTTIHRLTDKQTGETLCMLKLVWR